MAKSQKAAEMAALPGYHIRWLLSKDWPQIMRIEQESFGESAWAEDDMRRTQSKQNVVSRVVQCQGEIVGFCMVENTKHRVEVLNMATDVQCRHIGVGRAMIGAIAERLVIGKRERICALVPERNVSAQIFFKRVGFVVTEIKKDALPKGEAALWFESLLIEPRFDGALADG